MSHNLINSKKPSKVINQYILEINEWKNDKENLLKEKMVTL